METQNGQWTSLWSAPELRLKLTSFGKNSSEEVSSLYNICQTEINQVPSS